MPEAKPTPGAIPKKPETQPKSASPQVTPAPDQKADGKAKAPEVKAPPTTPKKPAEKPKAPEPKAAPTNGDKKPEEKPKAPDSKTVPTTEPKKPEEKPKAPEPKAAPTTGEKEPDGKPKVPEPKAVPATGPKKPEEKPKAPEPKAAPTNGDKKPEEKPNVPDPKVASAAEPKKPEEKSKSPAPKAAPTNEQKAPDDKPTISVSGKGMKEIPIDKPPEKKDAPAADPKAKDTAVEPPKGVKITQIFDDRLDKPTQKDLESLPIPGEGEGFSMRLHPAYFFEFLDHPFSVNRETDDYRELFDSIKENGINEPIKARPREKGGLELISGHRRHDVAMQLNYPVPVVIVRADDDSAQIECVDGNLHRKDIPTSELARAAKMKLEAMGRKVGRRSKMDQLTAPQKRTDQLVAEEMGYSRTQLTRLVRIDSLIPELKQLVDSKKVPFNVGVELSYMNPQEQKDTQAFQELYHQADKVHGGGLPVPVRLMFDEFANVALPDGYARLQATMRSRNIMATIVLQNISQLKALFKDDWEGIIGNADSFVYLGGNEQSTHKYVSELLGKETIDTRTSSQSKGHNGSFSQNFQQTGRELMTPDEVRMLDNKNAIVLIRGEPPVIDQKYDLMKHPNIKQSHSGGAFPYVHAPVCMYAADDLNFTFTSLEELEIIEMEEPLEETSQ